MNGRDWLQLAVYFAALAIFAPLLGRFLAAVFTGASPCRTWPLKIVEVWTYRQAGCMPRKEMRWTQYSVSLLWFNLAGLLALNTHVWFVTYTSWQAHL
jgi:K+-transporting ATPase ATPase A chain